MPTSVWAVARELAKPRRSQNPLAVAFLDGSTFELAVVTEGEFKAAALWQAFHGSETVQEPPLDKLIYLRPHKGGIEGKAPKLFLTPSPKGQIGICAMPGITFAKREGGGWGIRTMSEDWLQGAGSRKVVIAYDNEEKGDPKLPGYKADPTHRHDAQVWARYLARDLGKDNKRFSATWGAGETELQALQFDLAHAVAHREVQEVALRGWHAESQLWFYGDCAYRKEGGTGNPATAIDLLGQGHWVSAQRQRSGG